MNGTTFDALAAAGTLREAGFGDRQAEAVAGVVRDAARLRGRRLADRGALGAKAGLDTGLAALCARLDRLETRFTVRMYGGFFIAGSLIVTVMSVIELFE